MAKGLVSQVFTYQGVLHLVVICLLVTIVSMGGKPEVEGESEAAGVDYVETKWWDLCAGQRLKLTQAEKDYDELLQRISYGAIALAALLLIFSSDYDGFSTINWSVATDILFFVLWFAATHAICVWGKMQLPDTACSFKPNGVSGHTCMHVFAAFSFLCLARERVAFKRLSAFFFALAFLFLTATSFAVLQRTYLSGYHTARQMVLGGGLGFCSHMLARLSLQLDAQHSARDSMRKALMGLFTCTAVLWMKHLYSVPVLAAVVFAAIAFRVCLARV